MFDTHLCNKFHLFYRCNNSVDQNLVHKYKEDIIDVALSV